MLSILIPTYNYNVFPLVLELHNQCENCGIEFEIIVLDDASTDESTTSLNQKINELSFSNYLVNASNLGRSENRNALISKAKFDWILFLDCDTFPTNTFFIANYLEAIQESTQAVFGGLAYKNEKPTKAEMLRWVYGQKREAQSLEKRKLNPYKSALVSNILLHRNNLNQQSFDKQIENYGFEDFVFINELKQKNIPITHIENPVYHLNLETSTVFLSKQRDAIVNLIFLLDKKIILPDDTTLGKTYFRIKRFHLDKVMLFFFKISHSVLLKNLTSATPSLFAFDLYKLGYFCKIKNK